MTQAGSFWARRKAGVAAELEAEERAEDARLQAERLEELADKDDAEILQDMGLPDPAEMKQGDDFAAFMSADVPEHLRKQALRTLWRSNPVLACVDGLNEYDDDYRAAMLLQEPIKTAYQVGKGMMAHIEEMERQAAAAEQKASEPAEDKADVIAQEVEEADVASEAAIEPKLETAFVQQQPPDEADQSEDASVEVTPRRMRFHFEEAAS